MADVIQLLHSCLIDGANGDWCYWHAMTPKIEFVCVMWQEGDIHISMRKWRQNYRTWKIVGHRKGIEYIMNVTAVFGKEEYSTSKKIVLWGKKRGDIVLLSWKCVWLSLFNLVYILLSFITSVRMGVNCGIECKCSPVEQKWHFYLSHFTSRGRRKRKGSYWRT